MRFCEVSVRNLNIYLNLDLRSSAAVKLDRLAWSDRLDLGTLDVDTEWPHITELTHPARSTDTDDLPGGRLLVTLVLVLVTGTRGAGEVDRVVPVVTRGTALTRGPGILRRTVALFSP